MTRYQQLCPNVKWTKGCDCRHCTGRCFCERARKLMPFVPDTWPEGMARAVLPVRRSDEPRPGMLAWFRRARACGRPLWPSLHGAWVHGR